MVEQEIQGHCLVIRINRPSARNAVDGEVARGLEAAIDRLESDADLRVGILTAAAPVFCAGADLKTLAAGRRAELSTARGGFAGIVRRERRKPLIAAVDGAALGGGTEIVLSTDLVVAGAGAAFGLPEVQRGLVAGAGGLFRLAQKVPANVAMRWALTGDRVSAVEAARWGLVNEVCGDGEALSVATEIATRIARNAPVAVGESRAIVSRAVTLDDERAWELTTRAVERTVASNDAREGMAAFAEKRPAVWTGT